jgi:hypothetical protein
MPVSGGNARNSGKNRNPHKRVIPAKAGIQELNALRLMLDTGLPAFAEAKPFLGSSRCSRGRFGFAQAGAGITSARLRRPAKA